MVAHLNVPKLTDSNLPVSLSAKVVTHLLKNEIGFNGLIVTDALNMKGASENVVGNIDLAAFLAGNDLLLISSDIPEGIKSIKKAYYTLNGVRNRLEESVKKILKAKFKAGLNKKKIINREKLYKKLNTSKDTLLIREAFSKAITLVKNKNNLIPLDQNSNYTYICLGDSDGNLFYDNLQKTFQ